MCVDVYATAGNSRHFITFSNPPHLLSTYIKKKKKKCKIKSHLIFYNYPCQKKIVKESGG